MQDGSRAESGDIGIGPTAGIEISPPRAFAANQPTWSSNRRNRISCAIEADMRRHRPGRRSAAARPRCSRGRSNSWRWCCLGADRVRQFGLGQYAVARRASLLDQRGDAVQRHALLVQRGKIQHQDAAVVREPEHRRGRSARYAKSAARLRCGSRIRVRPAEAVPGPVPRQGSLPVSARRGRSAGHLPGLRRFQQDAGAAQQAGRPRIACTADPCAA